jgi:hypothetical protein
MRPALVRLMLASTLLLQLAVALPAQADSADLDHALPDGHFYQQANGQGGQGNTGYAITDTDSIPFWSEYQRLGGPSALGYPASRRFTWEGFTVQVMPKVVFQWHPDTGQVAFVNVLDRLHDLGKDDWLLVYRQTPRPADTAPDAGLSWPQVEQRHWSMLDTNAAIKARYWADGDPLDHFGLPMAVADMGNSFVVRAQRAVFQYWKVNVPWAKQGEVTIANAGDLAKEAGLFSGTAVTPVPATDTPPARTHDWRTPGFVSDVGGQLFDPYCVPLRAVGSNVPNLPYYNGLAANLEWMRQHHLRWMRVFATGHGAPGDHAPTNAADAIQTLRTLLHGVDAFNSAHDPSESIYVLVSLTDYYPPGVPGDGHAYDHPIFAASPVLPAPWYRAGVRVFNFLQTHGFGWVYNLPNYEVNYTPWVQQVVPALSTDPALMGWQLGNELKARGSPQNSISSDQAYSWYLDFSRDIVDTIRGLDPNHLIVMGAQYVAELTDWEYRPMNTLQPERVPQYRQLVQRMLNDCGTACWNVWSLTAYDFNPYPIDDAQVFGQQGVAVVATEYGFTLGPPAAMATQFGGDRAAALRNGMASPWQTVDGATQPRQWSVAQLIAQTGLDGVAPWASPAPGPNAGFDEDSGRGVTGTPDESAVWSAWGDIAAGLQATNQAAGPSSMCEAYRSAG